MPKFKEKPKGKVRREGKSSMLSPRQAAKLLKDRYVQQLDQKQADRESEATYAVDRVENAGRTAVEEVKGHIHAPSPRQRERPIKERPRQGTAGPENAPFSTEGVDRLTRGDDAGTTAVPKERRAKFKTRQTAEARYTASSAPAHHVSLDNPSIESIHPNGQRAPQRAAGRTGPTARQAGGPRWFPKTRTGQPGYRRAGSVQGGSAAQNVIHGGQGGRRTAGTPVLKRRGGFYAKAPFQPKSAASSLKAGPRPLRAARQGFQRQMTQKAAQKAVKTASRGTVILRQAAQAAAKAVASLVSALAGLVGGGVLLILLIAVIIVAAIASSPLGIFFTGEPSAPDTVSISQAVSTINIAYNEKLEDLQSGSYDDIVIQGQGPDWADVLAVFAVKTSGTDQGVDVATLDADRVGRLEDVFWDMTALSSEVETIEHPATKNSDAWTETILRITISAKTADAMRSVYAFTEEQNEALDALLEDPAALASLAGSLSITDADAREVLSALPDDLSPERRAVVETALTLYGKVNYFWGGKSLTIGWDSRWGTLQKVTAAGSSTTGTYRPYGMDCSGFVDWVFYNMTGGEYIIGHGGGAHAQHTYCTPISWEEAVPGDLVFYPDDEHVGIVCGRDESGGLQIIHCASGANNVVITGVSGFTSVARPDYYGE